LAKLPVAPRHTDREIGDIGSRQGDIDRTRRATGSFAS